MGQVNEKTESRGKYLAKNTAIFAIGSIATRLITFFLVPLYTNILTDAEYGVIDLINTICSVVAPVIILNINEAIMRFCLDKDADYDKIMSIGLSIFGAAVAIGTAIIPISNIFSETENYATYIYFYTISFAASLLFLSYLRGKEKLVQFSIGNILHTVLIGILNIVFLAFLGKGVEGYFTAYIISNFATALYAFIVGDVISVIKRYRLDLKLASEMSRYSFVLIPNTFMWWIINSSDRVMVTSMIGIAANGIYAISYKLPSLIQTISVIFNQAWSYSAIRENESADREEYNNKVYFGVVGLTVISGVGLMAIMKPFMGIYVGEAFYEAWKYTPYLIIGYVFLTQGTFLATSYTVNKDSKGYLFSGTCGAIINVVLNFAFIPVIGVSGAALATCLSFIAVFIYRYFDTKKYLKLRVFEKRMLVGYGLLIATGFTMFINNIYGQILLVVELVTVIFLFSGAWMPIIKSITKKVRE